MFTSTVNGRDYDVRKDQEKIMAAFSKSKAKAKDTLRDEKKAKEKINEGYSKLNDAKGKSDKIAKLFEEIKLLFEVVSAWISGTYREIPYGTLIAIFGAILYFISPIDFIPDFIPFIGFIDDALVISLTLNGISYDLDRYREWKYSQTEQQTV